MDGTWFKFDPAPKTIPAPEMLQPDGQNTVTFEVTDQIGSAGLYTDDECNVQDSLL